MISGACTPTPAMTTKPSVAARLYAGAVDARPITALDSNPSAPDLRPLSAAAGPCSVTLMVRSTPDE